MRTGANRQRAWRSHLARVLFPLQSFLSACLFTPAVRIPVPVFVYPAHPGERARNLVVLLPGKGSRGEDFRKKGFIATARAAGLQADLEAVDLHFGYYRQGIFLERLWQDVVQPARLQGYEEIRLVGISMGAAGAMGLVRAHPESVTGVVLIAPYLGPDELADSIRLAGGLRRWSPESVPQGGEFEAYFNAIWGMLQSLTQEPAGRPRLTLAFGETDRFVPAQRLVADALPPDRVFTAPGGHRWGTWKTLWSKLLQADVLTARRNSLERSGAISMETP